MSAEVESVAAFVLSPWSAIVWTRIRSSVWVNNYKKSICLASCWKCKRFGCQTLWQKQEKTTWAATPDTWRPRGRNWRLRDTYTSFTASTVQYRRQCALTSFILKKGFILSQNISGPLNTFSRYVHDWSGFQSGLCQFFYVGTRLVSHSFHCCYVWLIWRATPDSWRSHKARQRQKRCDELMKRAKVNEKWEISKHWRAAAGSLLWRLMSRSQFYNAFYEAHPNCRSHVHTSHWCCCWRARSMLEAASPINTCDGAAWPRALLSLVFTNSALVTWLRCTLFFFPLPCGLWRKHCSRVSPHVFSSSCLRSHDNGPWAKHCFTSNGCLWWDTENRKMNDKVGDDGGGWHAFWWPDVHWHLMVWWSDGAPSLPLIVCLL